MTIGETGWQPIRPTGGDGDRGAAGKVEMISGLEDRPCVMCKSWEYDVPKLIRHLMSKKLTLLPNGHFLTPIAKDFPGRKSLILDPVKNGFCRYECSVTEDLATCENWNPVRTVSELQSRLKRR